MTHHDASPAHWSFLPLRVVLPVLLWPWLTDSTPVAGLGWLSLPCCYCPLSSALFCVAPWLVGSCLSTASAPYIRLTPIVLAWPLLYTCLSSFSIVLSAFSPPSSSLASSPLALA
uniref:Uncharacterized protein n=1 Tax=Haptolina brevifila TaxID=156173 RepID=A0A7S2CXN9_9EUKA